MGMPIDLVLVRHGNSEGNVAVKASKDHGDDTLYTPEYMNRHSSKWRLTDRGREEAKTAGAWLRENFAGFDRYITSEYTRALETAGYLGLPGAQWYREFYLRERDRGIFDVMPHSRIKKEFGEIWSGKKKSHLFWAPPGGESVATLCMRIDRVLDTLHRECDGKRVIIVCHGEVIRAFRLRIERMTQEDFITLEESKTEQDTLFNGQIIHYSRRNPASGAIERHINWKRMIRADDPEFSRAWEPIVRKKFSNEELIHVAEQVPQIVNEKTAA